MENPRVDDPCTPVQGGRTTTRIRRNNTEATRILARDQGWGFNSDEIRDDQGLIAFSIEDLAAFAEDVGWIRYSPLDRSFLIYWSEIPTSPSTAAEAARAGMDDEGKHPGRWALPAMHR